MDKQILQIAQDIKEMKIRGAAKIGRTVATALKIEAENFKGKDTNEFIKDIKETSRFLLETRPTAVSLENALRFVLLELNKGFTNGEDIDTLKKITINAADEFCENSNLALERIAEIGSKRIRDGDVIFTHCNSSMALAIIKKAHRDGKKIKVFADETRPRLQGLLTAKELLEEGIDVTLIVDSAARIFIREADHVIIGADAVAANGAVVNKVGTATLASIAHEARVKVIVAAETYKFHPQTYCGELIEIEERDIFEVISEEDYKKLKGLKVKNPAFDVTPPEFIDLIVTEKGIIAPQAAILVLKETYGLGLFEKELWED
ncbi:MAG: Ribose 1,5-bisphosphate isomerase [Candidatus Methanofastidiosum methylothiophilum]|uniref:Ribose 1,5-bisphosphate isomerase n=1 Tax=Candidatus Methanofastidiosum methylothiophilum TaxID=1705564 RepID=A0A150IKF9_9EURY|nr:MAG: Ribose 1,5-bisphosphate isomerase [Candidatus Methanofastidiosum methylthiophilus]NMC77042.1 ribose 1,5-bisphosphate isomerase [Candidatus Methanofastidiosa archaeon]